MYFYIFEIIFAANILCQENLSINLSGKKAKHMVIYISTKSSKYEKILKIADRICNQIINIPSLSTSINFFDQKMIENKIISAARDEVYAQKFYLFVFNSLKDKFIQLSRYFSHYMPIFDEYINNVCVKKKKIDLKSRISFNYLDSNAKTNSYYFLKRKTKSNEENNTKWHVNIMGEKTLFSKPENFNLIYKDIKQSFYEMLISKVHNNHFLLWEIEESIKNDKLSDYYSKILSKRIEIIYIESLLRPDKIFDEDKIDNLLDVLLNHYKNVFPIFFIDIEMSPRNFHISQFLSLFKDDVDFKIKPKLYIKKVKNEFEHAYYNRIYGICTKYFPNFAIFFSMRITRSLDEVQIIFENLIKTKFNDLSLKKTSIIYDEMIYLIKGIKGDILNYANSQKLMIAQLKRYEELTVNNLNDFCFCVSLF